MIFRLNYVKDKPKGGLWILFYRDKIYLYGLNLI